MENFTPVSGFVGGVLIGVAALLLLLLNGRIAGVSGILGGLLDRLGADSSASGNDGNGQETAWRLAFVLGLVIGPVLVGLASGAMPLPVMQTGWPGLVAAGLLVGVGTRLGSGCTSGHGVCGMARGSRRSIAATVIFFTVALVTVFVVRHLLGA